MRQEVCAGFALAGSHYVLAAWAEPSRSSGHYASGFETMVCGFETLWAWCGFEDTNSTLQYVA